MSYQLAFWLLFIVNVFYISWRIWRLFNKGTTENENKRLKDTLEIVRKQYKESFNVKIPKDSNDMAEFVSKFNSTKRDESLK